MGAPDGGIEWIVDAGGCDAAALGDRARLDRVFRRIVEALDLHPVGPATWHKFPAPGGLTGAWILAESHLTIHTFPEHGSLCLNLFCCRRRRAPDWAALLAPIGDGLEVRVRRVARRYARAEARC